MEKIKVANHKYICPECKGNGYNKVYDMIIQCDKCKSQGELDLEEPTLEELQAMANFGETIKFAKDNTASRALSVLSSDILKKRDEEYL